MTMCRQFPVDSEPVRMIAGMSRSGTNWLCKSLNGHPEVAAFGESRFFARCYVSPGKDGMYTPAQAREVVAGLAQRKLGTTLGDAPGCLGMSHRRQKAIIMEEFARIDAPLSPGEIYCRMCSAIARGTGRRIPVEKTPQHILWLSRITACVPQFRMVVMIRNPYDFMLSYKHQGDRRAEESREAFAQLYHPLACAHVWKRYMRAALSAQQRYPEQILIVRNEELKDPSSVLARIQTFLNIRPVLDLPGQAVGTNSSFPDGTRPELAPEDVYWMNVVADREIDSYGCERQPLPQGSRIAALRSLGSLPRWAMQNTFRMRRLVTGSTIRYLANWL